MEHLNEVQSPNSGNLCFLLYWQHAKHANIWISIVFQDTTLWWLVQGLNHQGGAQEWAPSQQHDQGEWPDPISNDNSHSLQEQRRIPHEGTQQ